METPEYLFETIQTEPDLRKKLFQEMIEKLEDSGKCCGNYHLLALYFFGDTLGGW
jgi:hypothetical protein